MKKMSRNQTSGSLGTEELGRPCSNCARLRAALGEIAAIENEQYGPDWEEIEKARAIAKAVLADVQTPCVSEGGGSGRVQQAPGGVK